MAHTGAPHHAIEVQKKAKTSNVLIQENFYQ